MKHRLHFHRLMKGFFRYPIQSSLVLSLTVFSLIGFGFCSWIVVHSVETNPIIVNVGDVKELDGSKGLADLGISIVNNSLTSLSYSRITDVNNGETRQAFVDSYRFCINVIVDTNKISEVNYRDDLFLTATFSYLGYSSSENNLINTLIIYPEEYPCYFFEASKSITINQEKNGTTTEFYFPLKTKNDVSISSVALLDNM